MSAYPTSVRIAGEACDRRRTAGGAARDDKLIDNGLS
jgi:hypothetical protein